MNNLTVIGGILGFVSFVVYLESSHMGNIIYRDRQFVPLNVVKYLKNPFVSKCLWHPRCWRANWIIMTMFGMLNGKIIEKML